MRIFISSTFRDMMRERDLLVLPVAIKDAPELRRRFHLPEGFCVVLIGKDGGQKASWQKIVRPEEVYRSIDEMPMRRREMQDQSKKPFTQQL